MENCSASFYLAKHDLVLFTNVIVPLLAVLALSVVAGCVCGTFSCWRCSYKVVAVMSTGVVIKLALIPDVKDEIFDRSRVQNEEEVQGRGLEVQEGSGEIQEGSGEVQEGSGEVQEGSGEVQEGIGEVQEGSGEVQEGIGEVQEGSGEVQRCDEETQVGHDGVAQEEMNTLVNRLYNTRRRIRKYFLGQQERTVFFKTDYGHKKISFWVLPFAPPCLLALAMLLVMSYGSVFITSEWTIARNCSERNAFGAMVTCYRGFDPCPPLNCTAWNELGIDENLFCMSISFNLFTPLERFVSLLAVQAALMQLFGCIVNKGCCLPFRYPPCRYTTICILDFAFIILVSCVTVYIGATTSDPEEAFQNLILPFVHLIFVSVAEFLVLFVFAALMWLIELQEENVNAKELFCPCVGRKGRRTRARNVIRPTNEDDGAVNYNSQASASSEGISRSRPLSTSRNSHNTGSVTIMMELQGLGRS